MSKYSCVFEDIHDIADSYCIRFSKIKDLSSPTVPIILVGNKSDLEAARVVSTEEGSEMAKSLGAQYSETSAKDNGNVTNTFDLLINSIMNSLIDDSINTDS